MQKYERLLYVINLIQANKNLKAGDIAERCGVSRRTIYRDIITLSAANIPIYYDDGYKFLRSDVLPPISLTGREVLLLNLAVKSTPMASFEPLKKEMEKVLAKINSRVGRLPDEDAVEGESWLKVDRSTTVGDGIYPGLYDLIEDSIMDRRICTMTYTNRVGKKSVRKVRPYNLVFRGRAFYLLAYCNMRQEYRLFRLERIREYCVEEETFERDKEFDPEKFFQYSWGVAGGIPHDIKIRFSPGIAYMISSGKRHCSENIKKLKNGSVEYTVRASGLEEIARWVLGFGGDARVIYPKELADMVLSLAKGACDRYGGSQSAEGSRKLTLRKSRQRKKQVS